jgi:hypothetical protein
LFRQLRRLEGLQAALQLVVAGRQQRQRPLRPARLLAEVAALLQPQARSTRWF